MQDQKKLNDKQFEKYKVLIKEKLGVHLNEAKRDMVQSKLSKLMRRAGVTCYDRYFDMIQSPNSQLWTPFVDEITTHKTHFFREDNHFNFIKNNTELIFKKNPAIMRNSEIKVWSSAASTGDEPYTLGMVLKESLPSNINIRILGTDISPGVIAKAQRGEYVLGAEDKINSYYLNKYFTKKGDIHTVTNDIKRLVTYRVFNLMDRFPFQGKFDIIFCRNVMIYFDNATQVELVKKFYNVLKPGGLLFIGHSESLTQKQYKFKYVQPTIYIKPE